ncbi:MAG: hypothetical protein WAU60_06255 [Candidatus Competibacter denitrificans]
MERKKALALLEKVNSVLKSQQTQLDMVQEHLHALYVTQQFLFSTLNEASPEIKSHFATVLDQVLENPEQIQQHPHLLRHLQDLAGSLQRPKAKTPQERRARLYLAWPPKPAPHEDEDH